MKSTKAARERKQFATAPARRIQYIRAVCISVLMNNIEHDLRHEFGLFSSLPNVCTSTMRWCESRESTRRIANTNEAIKSKCVAYTYSRSYSSSQYYSIRNVSINNYRPQRVVYTDTSPHVKTEKCSSRLFFFFK